MEEKVIATNRKAYHDYFIEETREAGIVLTGPEVKSVRQGRINLKDSYVMIKGGEAWLLNCHISPYSHAGRDNSDPTRTRKLLLHKQEIGRLAGKVAERGYTIVPLRVYLKRGLIKLEIALAKGKKLYDKREAMRRKDMERELSAEMKRARR